MVSKQFPDDHLLEFGKNLTITGKTSGKVIQKFFPFRAYTRIPTDFDVLVRIAL